MGAGETWSLLRCRMRRTARMMTMTSARAARAGEGGGVGVKHRQEGKEKELLRCRPEDGQGKQCSNSEVKGGCSNRCP